MIATKSIQNIGRLQTFPETLNAMFEAEPGESHPAPGFKVVFYLVWSNYWACLCNFDWIWNPQNGYQTVNFPTEYFELQDASGNPQSVIDAIGYNSVFSLVMTVDKEPAAPVGIRQNNAVTAFAVDGDVTFTGYKSIVNPLQPASGVGNYGLVALIPQTISATFQAYDAPYPTEFNYSVYALFNMNMPPRYACIYAEQNKPIPTGMSGVSIDFNVANAILNDADGNPLNLTEQFERDKIVGFAITVENAPAAPVGQIVNEPFTKLNSVYTLFALHTEGGGGEPEPAKIMVANDNMNLGLIASPPDPIILHAFATQRETDFVSLDVYVNFAVNKFVKLPQKRYALPNTLTFDASIDLDVALHDDQNNPLGRLWDNIPLETAASVVAVFNFVDSITPQPNTLDLQVQTGHYNEPRQATVLFLKSQYQALQNHDIVITTTGQNLIADALANGNTVNLTHFAVDDGNGQAYYPTEDMTTLVHTVYTSEIAAVNVDGNTFEITMVIPEEASGFFGRAIGLLTDNDELFAVGSVPLFEKSDGSNKLVFIFHIVVSNADALQVIVNHSLNTVDHDELDQSLQFVTTEITQVIDETKTQLQTNINNVAATASTNLNDHNNNANAHSAIRALIPTHNTSTTSHTDIRNLIANIQTYPNIVSYTTGQPGEDNYHIVYVDTNKKMFWGGGRMVAGTGGARTFDVTIPTQVITDIFATATPFFTDSSGFGNSPTKFGLRLMSTGSSSATFLYESDNSIGGVRFNYTVSGTIA